MPNANFGESRASEVRRIYILGRWVNKVSSPSPKSRKSYKRSSFGGSPSPLPLFLPLANLLDVNATLCRDASVCIKGCGRVNRTNV